MRKGLDLCKVPASTYEVSRRHDGMLRRTRSQPATRVRVLVSHPIQEALAACTAALRQIQRAKIQNKAAMVAQKFELWHGN
jgi:hypothetical protein